MKLVKLIKVNPNKTEEEIEVNPKHVADLLEFKPVSGMTYRLPEGVNLEDYLNEVQAGNVTGGNGIPVNDLIKKSLFLDKNEDGTFKMPDEIFAGHYLEMTGKKPHHSAKRENLVAQLVDAELVVDDSKNEDDETEEIEE